MEAQICTHEKPLINIRRCLDCGSEWRVTDKNIVPVLAPCPLCRGMVHAAITKQSEIFWQCHDCQNSFEDHKGTPTLNFFKGVRS